MARNQSPLGQTEETSSADTAQTKSSKHDFSKNEKHKIQRVSCFIPNPLRRKRDDEHAVHKHIQNGHPQHKKEEIEKKVKRTFHRITAPAAILLRALQTALFFFILIHRHSADSNKRVNAKQRRANTFKQPQKQRRHGHNRPRSELTKTKQKSKIQNDSSWSGLRERESRPFSLKPARIAREGIIHIVAFKVIERP